MEQSNREELIDSTIRSNLKKMGYDYDSLTKKTVQYLTTIETSITETFELEHQAREMISRNIVSVKGVSTKTGIARQTLYNNNLLKEYIEFRADEFDRIDASKKDTAKDEQIRQMKEEITALHVRDVEIQELKRQMTELKKQLKEKDELIAILRQQSSGKVIAFPGR